MFCKWGTLNSVRDGAQVADRRRWQSAMTSPIGDVGSERVNFIQSFQRRSQKCETLRRKTDGGRCAMTKCTSILNYGVIKISSVNKDTWSNELEAVWHIVLDLGCQVGALEGNLQDRRQQCEPPLPSVVPRHLVQQPVTGQISTW